MNAGALGIFSTRLVQNKNPKSRQPLRLISVLENTAGVRFAADDFGTGYSCLQHLKCCPIGTLKIDQSFVAGLTDDARDRTIVRSIVQLAHGLGMDVVAEGVETPASPELLRQVGCDAVQGFLFAKPMPAAEFAHFVSHGGIPP